jgi:hypothetical protein
LNKLDVKLTGLIELKPDFEERVAATISLGQNELWSSVNFNRQLLLLGGLVSRTVCNNLSTFAFLIPSQNEASTRAWIETFFFRASTLLPPNQCMALSMEHIVPASSLSSLSTLSGLVDYTAIVASQDIAGKFCLTFLNCLAYCS